MRADPIRTVAGAMGSPNPITNGPKPPSVRDAAEARGGSLAMVNISHGNFGPVPPRHGGAYP
jgi:hypothetical protein